MCLEAGLGLLGCSPDQRYIPTYTHPNSICLSHEIQTWVFLQLSLNHYSLWKCLWIASKQMLQENNKTTFISKSSYSSYEILTWDDARSYVSRWRFCVWSSLQEKVIWLHSAGKGKRHSSPTLSQEISYPGFPTKEL